MNHGKANSSFELRERHVDFAYDYRMLCGCGRTSMLTAAEYFAEANNAHMDCDHCAESIHFGPAVAALRDENDPALCDECVSEFAWYHTTKAPDWPASDYATHFERTLRWVDRGIGLSRDAYVAQQTSKALHVGTYEAAIENMLRRMRNQADGASQFYLYRVALRVEPGRINKGYRDENYEAAASISVRELDELEVDALRYLNVHEAMGTLSLAVRPAAIAAVQRLVIPVPGLSMESDAGSGRLARERLIAAARALKKVETGTSRDPLARAAIQRGAGLDPTEVAQELSDLELAYYRGWNELEQQLGESLMPNVSPVVRRDFNAALSSYRRKKSDTVAGFITRYRELAALLERADAVIARFNDEKWRRLGAVRA